VGHVRSAVVTGAAGFLGSHLTDALLARGTSVVGIDNLVTGRARNLSLALSQPRFTLRRADLVRGGRLPRADLWIHLASPASPPAYLKDPIGTLRVNAEGTHRVLDAARRSDGRVVLASTSETYGDPEVSPQPEEYWGHVNPVGPRSCYDEGKRFAEAMAVAFHRTYGLDVRIARIFNTYGPRMAPDDGRVVSNFIVQGLHGRPLTIYGSGRQTRSFCYVDELVDGILRLADAPVSVPTPMNLGNPEERTVLEIAREVMRVIGRPLRLRRMPLPEDDPRRRCPDITLARRHLRWRPSTPLREGLVRTVAYFRESAA
jgi:nucleoside-diphosphate-sugar epimerase